MFFEIKMGENARNFYSLSVEQLKNFEKFKRTRVFILYKLP